MTSAEIIIRAEQPSDIAAIHAVEAAAFGREAEARLVDALRDLNNQFISLVARQNTHIVGHICFSRVVIQGSLDDVIILALAPLAVHPEHQGRGIGSMLVRSGLDECRRRTVGAIFVVGDPGYYFRFGFAPASERGVRCEFDVPADAFRVIELHAGTLRAGLLKYPPPFHG